MVDTSAASLPHASSSTSSIPQANPSAPPTNESLPSFARASSDPKKPTVAQASTTAHPVISPPHSRSASATLIPSPGELDEGVSEDDDGASIVGRAVNIAHTAKGLIGHLWGYADANPSSTSSGHQ